MQLLKSFGIENLLDSNTSSFWQSDDATPHYINIQFKRKMYISDVCIYMDFKNDESYTPNKMSIRAGSHFHDLLEVELVELAEPNGWLYIPLRDRHDKMVKTFMLQIVIISNHQNGKDTHLRQIRVHTPNTQVELNPNNPVITQNFSSVDMKQFSIR
ncbi:hypothetical protein EB796_022371 [Bugula neritina]|uniref:Anaphase-promoting complex subunit 10 n=1 Tax=Bugula neritina TaxID=10212 RepID=A0A7J7IZK9_BUGNE|nr:hypothetical protein EB796_022371 [Bugula neritina]